MVQIQHFGFSEARYAQMIEQFLNAGFILGALAFGLLPGYYSIANALWYSEAYNRG